MNSPIESEVDTDLLNEETLRSQGVREQWMLLSLATPAVLTVAAIILIPVGWLFYLSFIGSDGQPSLEHYQKMIEYKSYARVFVTTFQVSILTTLVCILIGYPLAYFLAILPQRLAGFFMLAVLLPFWTSLLVRTYAWLVLLQKNGILNDFAIYMGLWETPVKLVHNMTGTLNRYGAHHAAFSCFASLWIHAENRTRHDARGCQSRRLADSGFLEGLFPFVAFRHGGRVADRFRPMPWVLCYPSGSGWRSRRDGGYSDHGNTRKSIQLGCGKRAWCCPSDCHSNYSIRRVTST